MAAELHQTRKVKLLAARLRDECTRLGADLPPGDSAARIVADKAEQIAAQLGVTTRTVLDRYLTDQEIPGLARGIARQYSELTEVLDDAPAVGVSLGKGLMVLAAFGMCATLALRNLEHSDAPVVLRHASDSTVHLAITLAQSGGEPADVGGLTLAVARKVLTQVIELLHASAWTCTCAQAHRADGGCALSDRLTVDLATLGGWARNADAR